MRRVLVIGDIHGKRELLQQCLDRAEITEEDKLIFLGDYVDGGGEDFDAKGVVDDIIKLENEKVLILGNHDRWFRNWLNGDLPREIWLDQGGYPTITSFTDMEPVPPRKRILEKGLVDEIINKENKDKYIKFFNSLVLKHQDENGRYIHAGIPFIQQWENVDIDGATWDRELIMRNWRFYEGPTLYLGHTATQFLARNYDKPIFLDDIVAMDTGAGHGKKLTIMDTKTGDYWQSDESGFKREHGISGDIEEK